MGILPALIETRSVTRTTGSPGVLSDFWYGLVGGDTKAGVQVSEKTALRYLTVFSCVSLIAGDMARLPLILYRRLKGGGKERVLDHPLYDIVHTAPNPEMTSFAWRESGLGQNLLWGNHYAMIKRRPLSGEIAELWPIDNPGLMAVKRDAKGRVFYEWHGRDYSGVKKSLAETDISGEQESGGFFKYKKLKKDMFHVPGFGFNGLIGLSMIRLAREAIGSGLAMEEFGGRYFGDGTHPSGMLAIDKDLGENEEAYKKALKDQYAGLKKSHGLMVFQNGEQYTPFTIPLDDAQFIQSRDHQKTEICGMYHVPPHKIALHGANSNYNNLEQENQGYVDSCLMHWAVRWEQSLAHQLLTPAERAAGLYFEFLMEGLLRGDSQSRSEFYNKLFGVGGISPNEIRARENMNPDPAPAADQKYVMLNMIPLDMAGDTEPVPAQSNARRALVENRSIITRERISRQYRPLFLQAAETIVNRERIAVKRQVKKQMGERADGDMAIWLTEYYRDFSDYVVKKIGPVMRSFSEAIQAETVTEIGADPEEVNIDLFVNDYISRYAQRHVDSSHGQLESLLVGELTDLEARVDEWGEKRPEKISLNETTRGSNAVYQAIAFSVGLGTYWRIRGSSTCDYCKQLNGKRVRTGQSFVNDGDQVAPGGGLEPMKIRGMKAHPPLHQGCDCYLSAG